MVQTPAGYSTRPDWGFGACYRASGARFGARFGACFGGRRDLPKTLSDFRSSRSTLVSGGGNSGRHGGEACRTYYSKCIAAGTGNLIMMMLCVASVSAFTPANLGALQSAKTTCLSEAASGNCPNFETMHGKIGEWDTSSVSTLAYTFYQASAFNQPIGDWNISSVSTLYWTFRSASAFNQPIGDWNTSSVSTLASTFSSASAFNQPIGDWDTSSVSTLDRTFFSASAFNQPIGDWDISSVSTLSQTFSQASAFNQPIDAWDVAKVTAMGQMLYYASSFNQTPWCTPSWGASPFPEKGYVGPKSARVSCCMQGEYLQNECRKCELGKYQDQDYTQIDSCAKCPRNRISPLNGAINCSSCGPGKFSNDDRTECTACPSGSHQVDYDTHSNCSECVEGRYQPDEGERACLDCDKGQYQDEKAKQYCLP